MSGLRLVSVAVPVPAVGLLTYRVPDDMESPAPGCRVLVPLGNRTVTGCVVGHAARPGGDHVGPLKTLTDVLDAEPFLPGDVVALALWVAEYYASGPGEAIAAALPPLAALASRTRIEISAEGRTALRVAAEKGAALRTLARLADASRPLPLEALASAQGAAAIELRRVTHRRRQEAVSRVRSTIAVLAKKGYVRITHAVRGRPDAFKTSRVAVLTPAGREQAAFVRAGMRSAQSLGERQRKALALLESSEAGLDLCALSSDGVSADTIRRLGGRRLLSVVARRVERDPLVGLPIDWADAAESISPTPEQSSALDRLSTLVNRGGFQAALLHGVTGSGKTEIYVRLAELVRVSGRGVLVLVPEIALTPAVALAFRRVFGNRVAVQHSGLSDGERYDQWHRIRRGDMDVVIGTRSAVFAPISSLGLIVIDEEHDGSYKQEESPRYNARDTAVMRAKQAGALAVLGSATPAVETYYNALGGRYERIQLTRRVLDRPLPTVQLVDMRQEYAAAGPGAVLSQALKLALVECTSNREQALVLLNRRGFANAVFCRTCASTLECLNCSVALTVHKQTRQARCHYCNYVRSLPRACLRCGGDFLELAGFGTERVVEEIASLLPAARVGRLDRDAARRRGAGTALLAQFARGELDVLVGTQMIAKGHDFPRVTLVGVISADVGLGLADFRASERTFQLLTQVAGRAGRGDRAGLAIVQTLYPSHYSVRCGCEQNYEAFFKAEMEFREAMRYPPAVALVNAVVRAPTLDRAMRDAARLAGRLRSGAHYRIVGPAPAPFSKLRGEYRAQFFLKGAHRRVMRTALQTALEADADFRRRVTIDVDPLSVL